MFKRGHYFNWANRERFFIFLFFVCLISFLVLSSGAELYAARQMQFTAVITDKNGANLEGDYSIRFAIYSRDRTSIDPYPSDSDAAYRVWQETQSVSIKNGILTTELGKTIDLPLSTILDSEQYYLAIRIGSDSEMVPRKKILPSLYSFNSINSLLLAGRSAGAGAGDIPVLNSQGKLDFSVLPPEVANYISQAAGGIENLKKLFGVPSTQETAQSNTLSANIISLGFGGTGLVSYQKGDLLYYNSGTTLSKLAIGADGQILTVVNGVPAWTNTKAGGGSVTVFAGGGGVTYKAGRDLNIAENTFNIDSQLDYVSVISLAASDLTLETVGSGNIFLNSANNVGIGTTSPIAKLSVGGSAALAGDVYLGATSTDSINIRGRVVSDFLPATNGIYSLGSETNRWSMLYLTGVVAVGGQASFTSEPTGTGVGNGAIYINPPSVADPSYTLFGIAVNGVEKMRMDATGNIAVQGNLLGPTGGSIGYWTRSGSNLSPYTSGDNVIVSGNIGIGTTSPYALLSLSNTVSTPTNTPLFAVASTTAGTATSTLFKILPSGNIGIGDIGGFSDSVGTATISGDLPTGYANSSAFSPDGAYLAVAHDQPPYLTIYKRSGDTFTKLANPTNLPDWTAVGVTFSPDGTYLVVTYGGSYSFIIYKRSGDTFTKLANPSIMPDSSGNGIAFSPDGTFMSVSLNTSPFIFIYKRSGDTFTKLPNPATLPPLNSVGTAFSPDGAYLVFTHNSSPYITIYKRSGDTFTKLPNPSTLPADYGQGVAFSPDGTYLAITHITSPYVTIYKRSGDTFTKLPNPATLPTGNAWGASFSPDNNYLVITHSTSPYVTIYRRSGDTFTKLPNQATLPTGNAQGASFSPDGTYLAISHLNSPYLTIYKGSGGQTRRLEFASQIGQENGISLGKEISLFRSAKSVLSLSSGNSFNISFGGLTMGDASSTVATVIDSSQGGYFSALSVGTTTPLATLSVQGTAGSDIFNVASSTGSPLFLISSTGNIGIGTTSPYAAFSVESASGVVANKLTVASTSATSTLPRLTSTGIASTWFCLGGDCRTAWPTFANSASTTLLADVNTWSGVNVYGTANIKITGGSSGQYLRTDGSGGLSWGTGLSGNSDVGWASSTDPTSIYFTGGSNVGIGSTSPDRKLTIFVNDSSSGNETVKILNSNNAGKAMYSAFNDSGINLNMGVFGSNFGSGLANLSVLSGSGSIVLMADGSVVNGGSNSIQFRAGGYGSDQERMRITSSGKIGIGTTTPNQNLSIYNSAADTALEFSSASGPNYKWTIGADYSNGGKFKIASSSALGTNDRLVIDGSGNIGIGTADPNQPIHLSQLRDASILFETTGGAKNTGATSGGTFSIDSTVGTMNWSTPENAAAEDGANAFLTYPGSRTSRYLKATNFGFNIPSIATITGVVVEVKKSSLAGTNMDYSAKLVKGGVVSGNEKADAVNPWPVTAAYFTYGGSSDLWGLALTPTDINSNDFGFVISSSVSPTSYSIYVDHIRVTVYYDAGGSSASWTMGSDFSQNSDFKLSGSSALGTNDFITVKTNGYMGIGSSSPYSLLSISNSVSTAANTPLFSVASTTAGTATTTLMTVLASGNVGIGTTSPVQALGVNGLMYIGGNGTSTIEKNLYVMGTLRSTISYNGDLFFANNFRFTEAPAGSLLQALILQNQNGEIILTADETGNIGIGTSSPGHKLEVAGDIGAIGFVNLSTKEAKKEIEYFGLADYENILFELDRVKIATYYYTSESGTGAKRLGLIAEEAPLAILSADGKGVDLYKLTSFTLAGVKALSGQFGQSQRKIDALEQRLSQLEQSLSLVDADGSINLNLDSDNGAPLSLSKNSVSLLITKLYNTIIGGFKSLGFAIEEGIVRGKKFIAEISQTDKLTINTSPAQGDPTIGTGRISAGEFGVYLANNQVTDTAKIFLTPRRPVVLGVCERNAEKLVLATSTVEQGFGACLSATSTTDVDFDWLIVETVNEPASVQIIEPVLLPNPLDIQVIEPDKSGEPVQAPAETPIETSSTPTEPTPVPEPVPAEEPAPVEITPTPVEPAPAEIAPEPAAPAAEPAPIEPAPVN